MVSFQALPSPNGRKSIPELDDSSKKRKWEESQTEGILEKRSKPESTKSFFEEIELHRETPLPLEWQRCLDIQSGQIHFYNTRTHKRTSRDPRKTPEPPSPDHHMSLDLELNLTYDQSQRKRFANDHITKQNSGGSIRGFGDLFKDSSRDKESSGGLTRRPSWLASERDQEEMVATVCTRCHMLVMLCRSSPACPNCKFLHPPDQSSPKLFK
ncbi:protein CURLY FLAG LEAF 1-like [Populus nigra]|uniref:protein CURLY FLAG LEAF 1-like n=1 Tax=Populus nigra TaxID=3691 RepID=UPI002B277C8C|nr:protein CURLY FLAG LEAF 1-like [Populus nigra]